MKKIILILVIIIVGVIGYGVYINFDIQNNINQIIKEDSRNQGIEVKVSYNSIFDKKKIIYDIKSISGDKSVMDVFRVFLQFSNKVKNKEFENITLSCKGQKKFKIEGDYFKTLGMEYEEQNPMYTIRTFPENVFNLDNTAAYSQWTGGILGVLEKQMEDFSDFNNKWYVEQLSSSNN